MSSTTNQKSAAFLAALDDDAPSVTKPAKASPIVRVKQASEETPAPKPARAARSPKPAAAATGRAGLKHIGGYFDRDDVEKIAVLRARLGLDNSQLIRLAVDDLFKKHNAKRAFGDA